jgi:hypothetical protein
MLKTLAQMNRSAAWSTVFADRSSHTLSCGGWGEVVFGDRESRNGPNEGKWQAGPDET